MLQFFRYLSSFLILSELFLILLLHFSDVIVQPSNMKVSGSYVILKLGIIYY